MKIIQTLSLSILVVLTGCNSNNKSSFPEDLMYKGNPIHPVCIMQTQDGDSSRLDPQKVYSLKDTDYISIYESLDYKETKNTTSFDPATHTVISKRTYSLCDQPMKSYDKYRYIGSYNGKHIIKTKSCELSSKALVTETLSLIERKNNTLQNIGEIAYDAYGRGIKVHSYKDDVIQFSQKFNLDEAIEIISNESVLSIDIPLLSIELLFQVDLNSPLQNTQYKHQLIGLILPRDIEDLSEENKPMLDIINTYIQAHKLKLNLEEAKIFAHKIIEIINSL